jgi:hypothetical protein
MSKEEISQFLKKHYAAKEDQKVRIWKFDISGLSYKIFVKGKDEPLRLIFHPSYIEGNPVRKDQVKALVLNNDIVFQAHNGLGKGFPDFPGSTANPPTKGGIAVDVESEESLQALIDLLKTFDPLYNPTAPSSTSAVSNGTEPEKPSTPSEHGSSVETDAEREKREKVAWLVKSASEKLQEIRNRVKELEDVEREVLTRQRVGQGYFREMLLLLWGEKCAVTGCGIKEMLVASHIKPWRDCSDEECLNPDNGLLLAAHLDQAFDRGLITFRNNGTIKIARPKDNAVALKQVGIKEGLSLRSDVEFSSKRIEFLRYHREHVFKDKYDEAKEDGVGG